MKWFVSQLLSLVLLLVGLGAFASVDVRDFNSEAQEAQYRALIEEFRCPKCQNQNLASSDAIIAQDLKQKTYELVLAGKSDTEIRDYMIARYGDFITYKPPVNSHTWWLWFLPPLILVGVLAWWFLRSKGAQRHQAQQPIKNELSAEESERLKALLKSPKENPSESST